ncbi:hypothetical protein M0R88_13645 [Halorussus gelatinilyticus]|uniref:ZIP Zinc transporter n=1 Tax=Halorussus gelatinilyticus TaxID=2937524 RepID=A0A8U0IEQ4_9EURY|nr:hypothetical protein [Halorussus gelatinilyticus]UPV99556.1 hypothetical protein M0R88_13645 [Halorussus gelatinilyticus]
MVEPTSPSTLVTAVAVALAVVHLFAGRLRLRAIPRSVWLSGAGGVSVAYVFVHLLPELEERQHAFAGGVVGFLEHHVYLLALVGFAAFYGLEHAARRSRDRDGGEVAGAETATSPGVFWLHVGSFAAYNALVGYLLVHREEAGLASLGFFAVAMALHFLVNDHGLRDHHRAAYDRVGRWLLAGGVLVGFAVGWATAVEETLVSALFAFLAGGVVLNVVKEELPEERRSNFWAFGAGSAAYAALLLLV